MFQIRKNEVCVSLFEFCNIFLLGLFKISDSCLFYGTDQKGNSLFIKLVSKDNEKELLLFLKLSDGRTYELPGIKKYMNLKKYFIDKHKFLFYHLFLDHPNTTFKFSKQSWTIGGLKISVLEPLKRFRIIFNGLLRNGIGTKISNDMGKIEHVRFNFM